ncbi:cytochrome P450 11B, mitochondrial-like isoform X2 [Carettochelys insculpta]|uniref:cytochrome P450 11B, mitochondrial-like isoform X2 n=1 Tax=Carettochelys insculpta TaxID=44489 RepID=UPI003EBD7EC9
MLQNLLAYKVPQDRLLFSKLQTQAAPLRDLPQGDRGRLQHRQRPAAPRRGAAVPLRGDLPAPHGHRVLGRAPPAAEPQVRPLPAERGGLALGPPGAEQGGDQPCGHPQVPALAGRRGPGLRQPPAAARPQEHPGLAHHRPLRRPLLLHAGGSYALYGERLGLLEESPDAESQRFIGGVETMLRTTLPLLFLPPSLARWTNAPLWREHMAAWDIIFKHADKCIQNIYQEFCLGQPRKYSGIMAELLLQAEMPLDAIKANMTEFTAGSVDTTAIPLLFTLFELARNPAVQAAIRKEVAEAEALGPRELSKVLTSMPLLKGALKETLRLYPVGITVQRYPTTDVVLQNYSVPAGTLCQVGLYAMGRSPEVFSSPERYDPTRWLSKEDNNFKALAFGFGARQCIGRRLAEAEMMLFVMHVLRNFTIDTVSKEDIKTIFRFILMPEKPPLLTFRPID